jgi:hypothetical protein
MRRGLAAAVLVVALGAAIVAGAARTAPEAHVAAMSARPDARVMPDGAAIESLRAVAAIGAGQARALRAAVRRCRARTAPGRCVLLPLAHAATGAKLSEAVLRGIVVRLAPGPCMDVASHLAGLVSTMAYLGVDGIRNTSPTSTWAAARGSARLGRRIIAAAEGAWPRHCHRIGGLRA